MGGFHALASSRLVLIRIVGFKVVGLTMVWSLSFFPTYCRDDLVIAESYTWPRPCFVDMSLDISAAQSDQRLLLSGVAFFPGVPYTWRKVSANVLLTRRIHVRVWADWLWLACPPAPAVAAFNAESLTHMKSLRDVTDTHARTSCEKGSPIPGLDQSGSATLGAEAFQCGGPTPPNVAPPDWSKQNAP